MTNRRVGKVLEQVGAQELHEGGGVAVQVVRADAVEVRVARAGDVDHRRHVELDHLLVERIPVPVGQRRVGPVAVGRIGVEVAADEAELQDAALELLDAVRRRHARRLRQLADADEVLRVERDGPMDQVVADARPFGAGRRGARMMRHAAGARREDRQVGAALLLEGDLVGLEAGAQLVVGDAEIGRQRLQRRVDEPGELAVAEPRQRRRSRGEVAVAVDDHG